MSQFLQANEVKTDVDMMRPIAYKTYKEFCKLYGIKLSKNGKKYKMSELAQMIYDYEASNEIVKNGLYFY
tara:strand:+ start:164 stop:373 length:210 start_codon:yes stop_codon:yes gene_type:complete